MNFVPKALAPATFQDLWAMGYRRLVPVIPPDGAISESSSLFNRIGTSQDARGKVPGVKGQDGKWHSFDWTQREADEADLRRWASMGAGIGVKMGEGLHLIDADSLDKAHAAVIQQAVVKHIGVTPCRIGNFPKAGYLCRVSEPIKYCRVDFGPLTEKNQPRDRVEILSDGRFAVFHGIHPKTKLPYAWPFPLKPFDQLPIVTPAQITALLEELRSILPAAKPIVTEGAATQVSQASLRGDPDAVRRAVEATPNTSKTFPTRESYLDYGYAIKAALPDHPDEAFELFSEWCASWQDGENEPDVVASDWVRMKSPYRRGASWLFELAEEHSSGQFRRTDAWFEEIPDEPKSLFETSSGDAQRAERATPRVIRPTPYSFPNPAQIPPRQWLYGDHYVRGYVSATVAPGGLGKSALTIVEALAMASGKALLGVEPKGQFRVWLWNGEDPMDELNRRVAAALQHYGLSQADVGDRLCLDSGHQLEIVLATEARGKPQVIEATAAALVNALRADKIDALVVDPFISAHRVSENDNGAIDLVAKRLAKIAADANAAVEIVHHVRKTNGAEVTVEDARGASALINAARLTRAMTRMTESEGNKLGRQDYWRFWRFAGVSKTNLTPIAGPPETADWFTVKSEALGNGPAEGMGASVAGDSIGVVAKAGLESISEIRSSPDQADDALRRIAATDWRADVRARDAWVGHPVAQAFGLDATDKADRAKINGILKRMRESGHIRHETGRDRNRQVRIFVRVGGNAKAAAPLSEAGNVFH